MTADEILQEAIDIATANGWNRNYKVRMTWLDGEGVSSITTKSTTGEWDIYAPIIFDKDFAKALWGDGVIESFGLYKLYNGLPKWKMHLMEMVLTPDPIKYLEENIGGENGNG